MLSLSSQRFDALIDSVQGCTRCDVMEGCTRVLSWANGPPTAAVMFVGEAPGRLGADRTAVPFHGDKAGDNFEKLLGLAGLARRDVFVTNAVLCNPRDEAGNNTVPPKWVLANCSDNLRKQINAVDPAIVVTLGSAALESTRLIEAHTLTGATATDFFYIRQKEGPYCVELGSRWFKAHEDQVRIFFKKGRPWLAWRDGGLFRGAPQVTGHAADIVGDVLDVIKRLSDGELKTKAYLTSPMKQSLREEREGYVQLNRPLL